MTQHLTISVLAANVRNLHSANGTATGLITGQIVSSNRPLPPCDSLVISECYTLTQTELEIDSLIHDRAIATLVRDRASDPLTECEIDRVSNWVIESKINTLIEWPIARSWQRLSPVAFHKILACNRCVQYNVVHYPLTYCHTYTHILSGVGVCVTVLSYISDAPSWTLVAQLQWYPPAGAVRPGHSGWRLVSLTCMKEGVCVVLANSVLANQRNRTM